MQRAIDAEQRMRRRGRRLCGLGWLTFVSSLALPSVLVWDGWVRGWTCFRFVFEGLWDSLLGGEGIGIYYGGFAVANGVMLASPLKVRFFGRDLRRLRRGSIVVALAAMYTASFPFFGEVGFRFLGIGYYAWVLSFSLVAAGIWHLALKRAQGSKGGLRPGGISAKERLTALRELEDFLNGGIRAGEDEELRLRRDQNEKASSFGS